MFKKSSVNKQLGLFSTPSTLMCKRESKQYDDELEWHSQFFRNVTCNIDEEVFRPLYTDKKFGRPTKHIRQLVAMNILKEGAGCSDMQLFENCRYNLLWRKALGLFTLEDECPCDDAYYKFRGMICEYEKTSKDHVNLFEECFKKLTAAQVKTYKVSGRVVRMDSKLISSNIAWYSRYEIIHETLVKSTTDEDIERVKDQMIRQHLIEFLGEDAEKTVYRTDSETMGKRLLDLGIVIYNLLQTCSDTEKMLLRRVFGEQYEVDKDGNVTLRDKAKISSASVQNPNDTDAAYRSKGGKKVKGYSTNITETCDEEGKPSLITDVQVKPANAADNGFVEKALETTNEVTGSKVDKLHADGAYQSPDNRRLAADEENGFEFVANGIQGKPTRFDLNKREDGTLEVTDKNTAEVMEAIKVKDGKWKIPVTNKNGKNTYRYFDDEAVKRNEVRRQMESIPWEERKKRNNVEASIFQYCFHTRNNKTRYRGLIKHTLQAIARCAWINMRRLFLFDVEKALQIA